MELGIAESVEELNEPIEVKYEPEGYIFAEDEPRVIFYLRAITRTTGREIAATVTELSKESKKKAGGKKQPVTMEPGNPLANVGWIDPENEWHVRETAKFAIADWKGVVNKITKKPVPCNDVTKVFLCEDIKLARWIFDKANALASVQIREDAKNSEASFAGDISLAS